MNASQAKTVCLACAGAREDFPFGFDTWVCKIGSRMFALLSTDARRISLKVDPVHGQGLRQNFSGVQPGYHLNKRHWVTVTLESDVPDAAIERLIRDSYAHVCKRLCRAERIELGIDTKDK